MSVEVGKFVCEGPAAESLGVPILVGFLATHQDGWEVRLGVDKTRAEIYAGKNRTTLEPMFVFRKVEK